MVRFAVILLVMLATTAHGQNRLGFEVGAGMPLFSNSNGTSFYRVPTPTTAFSYLHQLNKWILLGAALGYQRYSFDFSYRKMTSGGEQMDGVKTKSNYLFLAPTLDIGIGKKQIIHAYISPAAGYLVAGRQTTEDLLQYGSLLSGNIYRSDDKIKKFMFRLNLGLEQHVWQNTRWHLVVNEGCSLISTPITTLPTSKTQVRPGYAYIQIGLQKLAKPRKQ